MYNFIDYRKEIIPIDFPEFLKKIEQNDRLVQILRGCLWFYTGQKNVTVDTILKFFSKEGLAALENDGFIKIIESK